MKSRLNSNDGMLQITQRDLFTDQTINATDEVLTPQLTNV